MSGTMAFPATLPGVAMRPKLGKPVVYGLQPSTLPDGLRRKSVCKPLTRARGSASPPVASTVVSASVLSADQLQGTMHERPLASASPLKAVVLGGGMAGLATAQALSSEFDEVVILERDTLQNCESSETRRGVPQYQQPHVLLLGGSKILEERLPGFTDDCLAQGATIWDPMKNMVNYDFGTYFATPPPGQQSTPLPLIGATRDLLERVLRRRVLEIPNVRLQSGAVASGLIWSPDKSRIHGVALKSGEQVSADLVVDASGRGTHTPQWLRQAGVPGVAEQEVISSGITYASRRYKRPADWPEDRLIMFTTRRPADNVLGILMVVENGEWHLICAGRGSNTPTANEAHLLQWLRNLPTHDIYDAIKTATPISPIITYSRTENFNNHIEKADMPEGLVVLGDAACSFNPIFGQGMTVAVKGADLLRGTIKKRFSAVTPGARRNALSGLPKEFQHDLAGMVAFPWSMATGDDVRHLRAQGKLPPAVDTPGAKAMNLYMELALRSAMKYWRANMRMATVMHLMEPTSTLFHPDILLRVIWLAITDTVKAVRLPAAQPTTVPTLGKES